MGENGPVQPHPGAGFVSEISGARPGLPMSYSKLMRSGCSGAVLDGNHHPGARPASVRAGGAAGLRETWEGTNAGTGRSGTLRTGRRSLKRARICSLESSECFPPRLFFFFFFFPPSSQHFSFEMYLLLKKPKTCVLKSSRVGERKKSHFLFLANKPKSKLSSLAFFLYSMQHFHYFIFAGKTREF